MFPVARSVVIAVVDSHQRFHSSWSINKGQTARVNPFHGLVFMSINRQQIGLLVTSIHNHFLTIIQSNLSWHFNAQISTHPGSRMKIRKSRKRQQMLCNLLLIPQKMSDSILGHIWLLLLPDPGPRLMAHSISFISFSSLKTMARNPDLTYSTSPQVVRVQSLLALKQIHHWSHTAPGTCSFVGLSEMFCCFLFTLPRFNSSHR